MGVKSVTPYQHLRDPCIETWNKVNAHLIVIAIYNSKSSSLNTSEDLCDKLIDPRTKLISTSIISPKFVYLGQVGLRTNSPSTAQSNWPCNLDHVPQNLLWFSGEEFQLDSQPLVESVTFLTATTKIDPIPRKLRSSLSSTYLETALFGEGGRRIPGQTLSAVFKLDQLSQWSFVRDWTFLSSCNLFSTLQEVSPVFFVLLSILDVYVNWG